jgi:hypothetical protein
MKKYALLLLLVLAPSTVAWAGSTCIQVNPANPTCTDDVYLTVLSCIPLVGTVTCVDYRVSTSNMIYVNVYLTYDPYQRGGSTKVDETVNIGDLCPGSYMVLARVYCSPDSCSPRYATWGLGATVFKVTCGTCPQPWPW